MDKYVSVFLLLSSYYNMLVTHVAPIVPPTAFESNQKYEETTFRNFYWHHFGRFLCILMPHKFTCSEMSCKYVHSTQLCSTQHTRILIHNGHHPTQPYDDITSSLLLDSRRTVTLQFSIAKRGENPQNTVEHSRGRHLERNRYEETRETRTRAPT